MTIYNEKLKRMTIDFNDIMDNRMVTNGEKMTEFIHRKVKKHKREMDYLLRIESNEPS